MTLAVWMTAMMAMAVPAKRVKRTIKLEDGSVKEVVLRGDERVHFYEDAEGQAFVQLPGGHFVREEKTVLEARWHQLMEAQQQRLSLRKEARSRRVVTRAWGDVINPVSGQKKGLVILVNFADVKMQGKYGNAYFNDFFNKVGFSENGMAGSVHDFFYESSYGKLDLTFDVVGPVTVSREMAYYGANNKAGNDQHPAEMVIEACQQADSLGTDFTRYDWDGDGYVDQVFVVYAGYSEASGAGENTIWPHEYDLNSAKYYGDGSGALLLDGVRVNTYAVSSELAGTSGSVADGIGTACHEFSHCLCLPDLYDTDKAGNFGMDAWSVMDYGCYSGQNGIGECPTAYTSYERMYCGWLTPVELKEPQNIQGMKALATSPEAYILYNEGNRNEYYLLENRQQEGFHRYDPAHGMLIIHVDFNKNVWINNSVNNVSTHQRVTVIPADNVLSFGSLSGDVWPGTSGNTSLTDSSKPAATLFNANTDGRRLMGKPIEQITERNGLVSFAFDGGIPLPQLAAPQGLALTQVTDDGFSVSWQPVEHASSYELELLTGGNDTPLRPEEAVLIREDFSGFNNGKTADGTQDVASKLDEYTQTPGWEGAKLYTTPRDEVKIGSGAGNGRLRSPWLQVTQDCMTLIIRARAYNKDAAQLVVGYGNEYVEFDMFQIPLQPTDGNYLLYMQNVAGTGYVYVGGLQRLYLSQFIVLDGQYSQGDLSEFLNGSRQVVAHTATRAEASSRQFFLTENTSFTFTGLSLQQNYRIRVRALADGYADSEWSETLSLADLTPVEKVKMVDGNVLRDVRIYDLMGCPADAGSKRGIYIQNGRKVMK